MSRFDPPPAGGADAAAEATVSKARLRLWLRLLGVTRQVEGELRERLRACDTTLPRFDVMAALHWTVEHARELGFLGVLSGPLVRSSYRAGRLHDQAIAARTPR